MLLLLLHLKTKELSTTITIQLTVTGYHLKQRPLMLLRSGVSFASALNSVPWENLLSRMGPYVLLLVPITRCTDNA